MSHEIPKHVSPNKWINICLFIGLVATLKKQMDKDFKLNWDIQINDITYPNTEWMDFLLFNEAFEEKHGRAPSMLHKWLEENKNKQKTKI